MSKKTAIVLFLVSIMISANYSLAQTGKGGATGLAFLKLGVGARAGGLGEAYSAVADDATAAFWNPAGLTYANRAQIAFTHTQWFQDITNEFLAFSFSAFRGTIGLSFLANNVGGIERRVNPSDEPIGTIDANDIAFGFSYAYSFNESLRGGLTVKYLYEKIFIDSASGYAFDFGLIFQPFANPLRLALVVQNLGSMDKLREQSIKLPRTFRLGASYLIDVDDRGSAIILAADGVKVFESDFKGNFGVEFLFRNRLAVRVGYQTGLEQKGLGSGIGLNFRRYHLDYGFTQFDSNFDDTHRFSFALDL